MTFQQDGEQYSLDFTCLLDDELDGPDLLPQDGNGNQRGSQSQQNYNQVYETVNSEFNTGQEFSLDQPPPPQRSQQPPQQQSNSQADQQSDGGFGAGGGGTSLSLGEQFLSLCQTTLGDTSEPEPFPESFTAAPETQPAPISQPQQPPPQQTQPRLPPQKQHFQDIQVPQKPRTHQNDIIVHQQPNQHRKPNPPIHRVHAAVRKPGVPQYQPRPTGVRPISKTTPPIKGRPIALAGYHKVVSQVKIRQPKPHPQLKRITVEPGQGPGNFRKTSQHPVQQSPIHQRQPINNRVPPPQQQQQSPQDGFSNSYNNIGYDEQDYVDNQPLNSRDSNNWNSNQRRMPPTSQRNSSQEEDYLRHQGQDQKPTQNRRSSDQFGSPLDTFNQPSPQMNQQRGGPGHSQMIKRPSSISPKPPTSDARSSPAMPMTNNYNPQNNPSSNYSNQPNYEPYGSSPVSQRKPISSQMRPGQTASHLRQGNINQISSSQSSISRSALKHEINRGPPGSIVANSRNITNNPNQPHSNQNQSQQQMAPEEKWEANLHQRSNTGVQSQPMPSRGNYQRPVMPQAQMTPSQNVTQSNRNANIIEDSTGGQPRRYAAQSNDRTQSSGMNPKMNDPKISPVIPRQQHSQSKAQVIKDNTVVMPEPNRDFSQFDNRFGHRPQGSGPPQMKSNTSVAPSHQSSQISGQHHQQGTSSVQQVGSVRKSSLNPSQPPMSTATTTITQSSTREKMTVDDLFVTPFFDSQTPADSSTFNPIIASANRIDKGNRMEQNPLSRMPSGQQPRIDPNQNRIDQGQSRLDPSQTRIDPSQSRLDQVQSRIDPGQNRIDQGQNRIDQGQSGLDPVHNRMDPTQSNNRLDQKTPQRMEQTPPNRIEQNLKIDSNIHQQHQSQSLQHKQQHNQTPQSQPQHQSTNSQPTLSQPSHNQHFQQQERQALSARLEPKAHLEPPSRLDPKQSRPMQSTRNDQRQSSPMGVQAHQRIPESHSVPRIPETNSGRLPEGHPVQDMPLQSSRDANLPQRLSDNHQGQRIPDIHPGSRLPDNHQGQRLPDSNSAQRIPDSHQGQRIPESHQGQRIPDSHQGQRIPESHQGQRIPDSHQGQRIPDSHQGQRIPESHQGQRIPDSHQGQRLPEGHPGQRNSDNHPVQRLPESHQVQRLPDSYPGQRLADGHPGQRLADSHAGQRLADSQPGQRLADSHSAQRIEKQSQPRQSPVRSPMNSGPNRQSNTMPTRIFESKDRMPLNMPMTPSPSPSPSSSQPTQPPPQAKKPSVPSWYNAMSDPTMTSADQKTTPHGIKAEPQPFSSDSYFGQKQPGPVPSKPTAPPVLSGPPFGLSDPIRSSMPNAPVSGSVPSITTSATNNTLSLSSSMSGPLPSLIPSSISSSLPSTPVLTSLPNHSMPSASFSGSLGRPSSIISSSNLTQTPPIVATSVPPKLSNSANATVTSVPASSMPSVISKQLPTSSTTSSVFGTQRTQVSKSEELAYLSKSTPTAPLVSSISATQPSPATTPSDVAPGVSSGLFNSVKNKFVDTTDKSKNISNTSKMSATPHPLPNLSAPVPPMISGKGRDTAPLKSPKSTKSKELAASIPPPLPPSINTQIPPVHPTNPMFALNPSAGGPNAGFPNPVAAFVHQIMNPDFPYVTNVSKMFQMYQKDFMRKPDASLDSQVSASSTTGPVNVVPSPAPSVTPTVAPPAASNIPPNVTPSVVPPVTPVAPITAAPPLIQNQPPIPPVSPDVPPTVSTPAPPTVSSPAPPTVNTPAPPNMSHNMKPLLNVDTALPLDHTSNIPSLTKSVTTKDKVKEEQKPKSDRVGSPETEAVNDDVSLTDILTKKVTPENKKNDSIGKHVNRKKYILSEFTNDSKQPNISPLINRISKEPSPGQKVLASAVNAPSPPPKSSLAVKLPTPKDPKKIRGGQERREDKKKRRLKEVETGLPPDPGYIPKVRITTFRALNGAALHQSNQFKPGEERTRTRSARRRDNFETKRVDISEMEEWERTHFDRKRKRRRKGLGLPSDEDAENIANNNVQDKKCLDDDIKRRQELLEREPVKLEDEPGDEPKDENHDFSLLIDSKAPIPRYHPSQPPKRLYLDEMLQNTKRCLECGDEFMFESSLHHHYDRKSIVIEINCMICKGKLIFYNKCQLLRHAREHTQNNEPMKFASPTIQPLSIKICQPRLDPPNLNTPCAKTCTECVQKFATRIGLQEHMQRCVENMSCEPCGMTLPNRCSYMAHTRIHTEAGNLVCPDCGENFVDNLSEFNKHIKLHCFHTSRIQGYRCPLSGKVFSRCEYLVSHIHNNLLIRFFKCAECPIAFRAQSKIMIHTKEEHTKTAMLYRPIYKCPLCKTVFHDKEQQNLPRHILDHVKTCTSTCFHCLVCPEVFETKAELAEHLSTEHCISEYKTSAEELQAALSAQRTLKRGSLRYTSSESLTSQASLTDSSVKMTNGGYATDGFDDDSDDSSFSDSDKMLRRRPSKSKILPKFRHKGDEPKKKTSANGKKNEAGAKIRLNCCRYCEFSSPKAGILHKHFQRVHNIDHITPDMIRTKITSGDVIDPSLPTTGRPVLVTPKGPISMRNMRKEPTQEELAKEDPPLPEYYTCHKCDFTHRNREEFQRHIKKHFDEKIDGFQCTECGNCFCSLTALEKHLYMTHKVRSVLQLDRIDSKFRDPIAPKKKETDLFTFRCQTCSKTFASEDVLKHHAKSHGLDYIKGLK